MCEPSWALIKGFRALEVVSGTPTFKASNQYFKNKSYTANAFFAIAVSNAKNGGDYNLIITKSTADDIAVSLPVNSKISGATGTSINLTGEENLKYWLQFTYDGSDYLWTLMGVSSGGGGGGMADAELLDYIDSADADTLLAAQDYCDNQSLSLPEIVSATYSFTLADKDKLKIMNAETAENFIIPEDATVPFEIGTRIHTSTMGLAGITTFLAEGGVTILAADNFFRLRTRYSCATIIKIDIDVWLLTGDMSL